MATIKLKPASDSTDAVFAVKKVMPISKTKFREIKNKKANYDEKKREREKRYRENLTARENVVATTDRLRKNQTKRKDASGGTKEG